MKSATGFNVEHRVIDQETVPARPMPLVPDYRRALIPLAGDHEIVDPVLVDIKNQRNRLALTAAGQGQIAGFGREVGPG